MPLVPVFPEKQLPLQVRTVRAAVLSTAGLVKVKFRLSGEYWSLQVYRQDGALYFDSGILKEFPGYEVYVPSKRSGYKVVLSYREFTPNDGMDYQGHAPYPFAFKKRWEKGEEVWFLTILPADDPVRLHAKLTARMRALRPQKPANRRKWNPESGRRNNEIATQTLSTWNLNNGIGPIGSTTVVSFTRTRGGTVTPNYLIRKKKGTLPVNAYSMTMESTSDGGYSTDTWNSNGVGGTSSRGGSHQSQWGSTAWGSAPASMSFNTNIENRAIRKLQEKVGPSANLAQDLAQIGQLTNMIGDSAIRIGASLRALKKGNLPDAVSHLWRSKLPRYNSRHIPDPKKDLANNWLALQYGWKPLLQDVKEAMDAIARLQLASVVVYTHRSSAKGEDRKETKLGLGTAASPVIGLQVQYGERIVRYGIRYQIENHLSTFLAQTGFANPINLAWEVLPFSFVFDWFVPIGPYLESITAWNGLSFLDGYKVVVDKVTTIWSTGYTGKLNNADANDVQMIAHYGSCRRESVSYVRTKLTSFPSQSIPSFKSPLSVAHGLNALALLEQLRK